MVYCPEVRILHLEDISTDYIYKTERKKKSLIWRIRLNRLEFSWNI